MDGWISRTRRRLGIYTRAELVRFEQQLAAKSNPVLASMLTSLTSSMGAPPEDQDFAAYLKSPGNLAFLSACANVIANAFAAVPIKTMTGDADEAEEIPGHDLTTLMENPNPEQGDFSFRYGWGQQIAFTGEGIIVTDNERGFIPSNRLVPGKDELWVVRTDRMNPVANERFLRAGKNEPPIAHWVFDGSSKVKLPAERVIQIKRPHPTDPLRGLSPVKSLETVLNVEHHLLKATSSFLKHGARPSGAFTRTTRPTDEDLARFKEQFSDQYEGAKSAGKTLFLWGDDVTYTRMGDSLLDANTLAYLDYTKQATMAVMGVPPFALALPDGTTWSNSKEQSAYLYRQTIIPMMELFLDTLNASWLVRAYGPDVYLAADYSGIEALQRDIKERAEVDGMHVDRGIRTINEIRAAREYGEDVEWGDEPRPTSANPFEGLSRLSEDLAGISRKARGDGERWRATYWKSIDDRHRTVESAWGRALRPLIDGLRARTLDTLERLDAETPKAKADGDPVPPAWRATEFFPEAQTREEWTDALRDLARRTFALGATDAVELVDRFDLPVDLTVQEAAEFIENRLATQVRTVLANRQEEIRALVSSAVEEGRTIGELSREMREWFGRNSRPWSDRIARTETAGLYGAGSEAGMREAGVVTKEWLSARDSDVRPTHAEADGQEVPVGGHFRVGDATGPYPGAMSTAAETVNCRCTVIPGQIGGTE